MKKNHRIIRISLAMLISIFISFVVSVSVHGQQVDTVIQTQLPDTPKTIASSPQKMFSEIARSLADQQQFLGISYTSGKIKYRIEDSAKLFPVPGGESRVALFEMPGYVDDYILTIRSLVHGIGYNYRMFAPTCVFFDSSFRPTHFLGEKNFLIIKPGNTNLKAIHLETEVVIDNDRKNDKYLLIYTVNKSERFGTYNNNTQGVLIALLKHPIIRSADGKIELELHLR